MTWKYELLCKQIWFYWNFKLWCFLSDYNNFKSTRCEAILTPYNIAAITNTYRNKIWNSPKRPADTKWNQIKVAGIRNLLCILYSFLLPCDRWRRSVAGAGTIRHCQSAAQQNTTRVLHIQITINMIWGL